MYESVIDLVGGEATMLFVELHYTLATEEAERIGVDHVARMSSNEAGESSLGELQVLYIFYNCYMQYEVTFGNQQLIMYIHQI